MPYTQNPTGRRRPVSISGMPLHGFDGGLNLRDAWTEVAPNESPLAYNVIYDERGAVVSRLGHVALNAGSQLPQPPGAIYSSKVSGALLAYISNDGGAGKLYKSTDAGTTWSLVYNGFTGGAVGAIVDFYDKVIVVNTLDGVYSFSSSLGASPTHIAGGTNNMDEVRGSTVAVWKNRVLVGGDPRLDASHSPARLYACKPGDPTTWNDGSQAWFNDIVEVNTDPITMIGAGQGQDINQKPALYVCKEGSAYRVNDDTTGAYTTLHATGAGASGPGAVATTLGRIVTINKNGIWETNGIAEPVRKSDRVTPLFANDLNASNAATWTGGVHGDRVVFSVSRGASTVNTLQIEYHPLVGWVAAHKGMSLGPMCVDQLGRLLAAQDDGGKIYQVGAGGTDDGQPITCFWSSKDFPLANGREVRLRKLRVWGRGSYQVAVRPDYARNQGDVFQFAFSLGGGAQWDIDQWDIAVWGDPAFVANEETPLEEVCRNAQIAVSATTSTVTQAPKVLDDGTAYDVGGFSLLEALVEFVPVGLG